jgi:hypothetical protein
VCQGVPPKKKRVLFIKKTQKRNKKEKIIKYIRKCLQTAKSMIYYYNRIVVQCSKAEKTACIF